MTALINSYTKQEFTSLIPEIDEATAGDLYDFFQYRDTKENFAHFLHQTALLYSLQYSRLLRDESVQYDAMVTDYIERLTTRKTDTTGTTAATTSETTTEKTTGTTTTTDRHTGSLINDSKNGNTRTLDTKDDGTTTGHLTGNDTSTSDSKSLGKSSPFQNQYDAGAGTFPSLSWDTSDGQQQTLTDNTDTTEQTTNGTESKTQTGTITDSGSGTGTETRDLTDTGNIVNNGSTEGTKEGNSSNQTAGSMTGRDTDRYTGRHGYSPAELLAKSAQYIKTTKAFAWICEKFNECFIWEMEI